MIADRADRERALEQKLTMMQQRIENLEKQLKEALEANDFLIKELQDRVSAMERM